MDSMKRAPECIDALEARIASNVSYWKSGRFWHVKANCYIGMGLTIEAAVHSWLRKQGLQP
jgi:hypothetical protein